jgi:hypothetical protein
MVLEFIIRTYKILTKAHFANTLPYNHYDLGPFSLHTYLIYEAASRY